MFSRYFFALCVIALFVAIVDVRAEESESEIEERNPAVAIVARIIARLFIGRARKCLSEAASHCRQHSRNPGAALSCGARFLRENRGRCLV